MKAQPVKLINHPWCEVSITECSHVKLIFPLDIAITYNTEPPFTFYPLRERYIPVQLKGSRAETGNWSWNGSTEKPTLHPSILSTYTTGNVTHRCHSFVNDGKIQFLADCSHEFAGQVRDLIPSLDS